jgi:hypothetical protein
VFLLGFAKNKRDNIEVEELAELRTIGLNWLNASQEIIAEALELSSLQEMIEWRPEKS